MAGVIWVSDREPALRAFFADVVPEGEVLEPRELESRLALGQRPDALLVDGTQLLQLPPKERASVLGLPRVLICTGMLLASMPTNLVSGPGVGVLAKPFSVEDLEAAAEWLRAAPHPLRGISGSFAATAHRRRPRSPRVGLPAT